MCPVCGGILSVVSGKDLVCEKKSCGAKYPIIGTILNFSGDSGEDDIDLSIDKWDEFYSNRGKKTELESYFKTYLKNDFPFAYPQLIECKPLKKGSVFLEIGCGPMLLARALSKECKVVIGVDFSLEALKQAEVVLESGGVKNYILILGDIKSMPIKDSSIDLLYGGGVIEHFKDTFSAIKEFSRVLKKGGVSFNTVPYLNIGSLTYRQVWGNIPNFPVLKQIAEFVHIKLLKSKHMTFGYELSFLGLHIKYLHRKAGFKKVKVQKFKTHLVFEFIPNKHLKKFFIWLAEEVWLFWPMVKVVGFK